MVLFTGESGSLLQMSLIYSCATGLILAIEVPVCVQAPAVRNAMQTGHAELPLQLAQSRQNRREVTVVDDPAELVGIEEEGAIPRFQPNGSGSGPPRLPPKSFQRTSGTGMRLALFM